MALDRSDIWVVMDAAVELNNIGVALLLAGRLTEALETFKGSARIMYPVSQSFQNRTDPSSIFDGPVTLPFYEDSPSLFEDKRRTMQKAKAELSLIVEPPRKDALSENSFIVSKPFLIEHLTAEPTSCTMESAIIVYNMGLAYRLYGSTPCVHKALCLFDMAFSLAFSVSFDVRSPSIAMASLNNAGEINHVLGHYALSRQYLNTLYNYIFSLPASGDEATMKERHVLLLNAMLLQEPKIAPAA